MPGFSVVCDFDGNLGLKRKSLLASTDSLIHDKGYQRTILLNDDHRFLAYTHHACYPIALFEQADLLILLEGKIYGKSPTRLKGEIDRLAELVFRPQAQSKTRISQWLLDTDGDFIVLIYSKSLNAITIVNDALGRLPLYYRQDNRQFIVVRETRFITGLKLGKKFDQMAIAQHLLFGYPLGKRTLFNNTYRLGPAGLIAINFNSRTIQVENLHSFNLDQKEMPHKTIEDNANQLARIFSVACVSRANASPYTTTLLGLSGGLDSRSVAACLHKDKIPFTAVTRKDSFRTPSIETRIAAQLAELLRLDWESVFIEPPRGKDVLKLLKIKSGMNFLGMAFILTFFEKLRDQYGPAATYFTGDGGDKMLHDLRPSCYLKTMQDCLNYVLSKNHIFSLDHTAKLTGIQKSDIVDELESHFRAYPENEYSQKYVHFLLFERGFKWLFEGEDRNRFYFWAVTPFYSMDFFKYAMECPDDQKAHYALYRSFLLALNPQVTWIDNANWGVPLSGTKYPLYRYFRSAVDKVPSGLKRRVKRLYQPRPSKVFLDCMSEQFHECKEIEQHLAPHQWKSIARRSDRNQLAMLLTVTAAIEELETGTSTLEKYYESSFV